MKLSRVVLGAVALWSVGSLGAAQIFNNFGPQNSFDPIDHQEAGRVSESIRAIGFPFVPDQDYVFTGASLALARLNVSPPAFPGSDFAAFEAVTPQAGAPGELTIGLFPDLDGAPDSDPLELFAVSNLTETPQVIDLVSQLQPTLFFDEFYWLVIFPSDPQSGDWTYHWHTNPAEVVGFMSRGFWNGEGFNYLTLAGQLVGAFSVEGVPVPEPSAAALLAGALALAWLARRRFLT